MTKRLSGGTCFIEVTKTDDVTTTAYSSSSGIYYEHRHQRSDDYRKTHPPVCSGVQVVRPDQKGDNHYFICLEWISSDRIKIPDTFWTEDEITAVLNEAAR